ncbi:MAG: MFS transporter [Candidatus Aminicenantes bacterium RBG_16_63_16]|nr:MAG: MFS transporter [Candidatus Aminicenantes bacterium RBG_16_63_16]
MERNPQDWAGRPSRVRYRVLAFLSCLAAITYMDRVAISITARHIMRDLHLSDVQMGFVFSAFTLAYGLFEIPTGWWGERIGTRKVLTRIVIWWSSFTIATAAAFNYGSLLVVRFIFGMGEAGAWPNAARTFSLWFPSMERGSAQGIFFAGAHFSAALTPLIATALLARLNWRWVFAIFGLVGYFWAFAWRRWFRDRPELHPSVNAPELELIESGRTLAGGHGVRGVPWKRILSNRTVLLLCAMYFVQSYGFYFYITWLPSYLERARGFSAVKLGIFTGLPMVVCLVSDLFGGLTTDALSRRFGLRFGRAGVGAASFLFAAVCILLGAAVRDAWTAAALLSLAAGGLTFLLGAAWGTCIDIAGDNAGVVSACMNTAGQVGGMLSPVILGFVLHRWANWAAPLYVTGLLLIGGAVCWTMIDPRRTVS